jgi:hypothetical protein
MVGILEPILIWDCKSTVLHSIIQIFLNQRPEKPQTVAYTGNIHPLESALLPSRISVNTRFTVGATTHLSVSNFIV